MDSYCQGFVKRYCKATNKKYQVVCCVSKCAFSKRLCCNIFFYILADNLVEAVSSLCRMHKLVYQIFIVGNVVTFHLGLNVYSAGVF